MSINEALGTKYYKKYNEKNTRIISGLLIFWNNMKYNKIISIFIIIVDYIGEPIICRNIGPRNTY